MLIYCLQMTVEKKINYWINNSFVNAVLQWLACLFYCCPLTVNHFIVSHVMVLSCCRKYFTVSLAIFREKKAVIWNTSCINSCVYLRAYCSIVKYNISHRAQNENQKASVVLLLKTSLMSFSCSLCLSTSTAKLLPL